MPLWVWSSNLQLFQGHAHTLPKVFSPPLFLFAFSMGSLLNLGGGILFVLGCQRGRNVGKMKFWEFLFVICFRSYLLQKGIFVKGGVFVLVFIHFNSRNQLLSKFIVLSSITKKGENVSIYAPEGMFRWLMTTISVTNDLIVDSMKRKIVSI